MKTTPYDAMANRANHPAASAGAPDRTELEMPAPVRNPAPGAPATERGPARAVRTYGALASPVLDAAGKDWVVTIAGGVNSSPRLPSGPARDSRR